MAHSELPLIVVWERIAGEVLDRTRQFPKSVRFTFASRIDSLALDVLEGLVDARFARGTAKAAALGAVDARLTRLRVLLRLSHARAYLSHSGYEHLSRGIDEAGRMLGGWRRQQAALP